MEYVPGSDCKNLLLEGARFDSRRLVEVASQLCCGLQRLHEAGLVHRDIKPHNVMIVGDLAGEGPIQVKLIDLGIARAPGDPSLTRTGKVVGTVPYIAPEVAAGAPANELSDVYGVGATLYELATGRRLPAESVEEIMLLQREEPLVSPHVLNPDLPRWLSGTIMRALVLNPSARFQSATEMEEALEAGADGATEILDPHEALTGVVDATEVQPGSAGRPGGLPGWARRATRPPSEPEQEGDPDFLRLLAFAAVLIMFTVLLLPVAMRIVVTLYELPRGLLTVIGALGLAAGWIVYDDSRRRAAGDAARKAFAWLRRRGSEQLRSRSPKESPPSAGAGEAAGGRFHQVGGEWVDQLDQHGGRRRIAWKSPRRPSVPSCLRDVRPHLEEVRDASKDWALWLGRRLFLALVAAAALSVAFWVKPELEQSVAAYPQDHRTILTLIPAAAWSLVAIVGFLLVRGSRARARQQLFGAIVLILLLAALALLTPSLPGWLEPRLWPPEEKSAQANPAPAAEGSQRVDGDSRELVEEWTAAEAAARERVARPLAARVRSMESRWMQLSWDLQRQGWSNGAGVRGEIHETATGLISDLRGPYWQQGSERARAWLASMGRAADQLTSGDCSEARVGPRGAGVDC